jgi:ring-1,2-phenylacetyl-CoA epoxidase subunit PaaE
MLTYTLKVVQIRQETADTVTICFKQPGLKKIKYLPGQYLSVIFRINGRRYVRPYSFSSSPGIDPLLEITVKRLSGGMVSNHICDKVAVDDMIEVMEPMGDFVLDTDVAPVNRHVVLWGVGSGITPLVSILKHILHQLPDDKVTLVYGNRNFDSVIFLDKIRQLKDDFGDRFRLWYFHTQLKVDEANPTLIQGRINPAKVIAIMHDAGELYNTQHYICGPAGLKESVKLALKTINIPEKHIFSEDFELVKDPKDFENIITRDVNIDFAGVVGHIEVAKGKSILEAGLDAFIDLPYSCQTGNCITCKAKILSGNVKMIGIDHTPAELAPDECLLCCSHPVSGNVHLLIQ